MSRYTYIITIFILMGGAVSAKLCANNLVTVKAAQMSCGPNALFMFLLLSGVKNISLASVGDMRVDSEGASLLQLRDQSAVFGVDVQVRRYHANQVTAFSLPAIVRLRVGPQKSHHFSVMYRRDESHAYLIDGTSGASYTMTLAPSVHSQRSLSSVWTGEVLECANSKAEKILSATLALLGGVAVGWAIVTATAKAANRLSRLGTP